MANPGDGEKEARMSESPARAASLKVSQSNAKKPTGETRKARPADDMATLAEMLRSWAEYAENAHVPLAFAEQDGALWLAIPGLTIDADGQIVPAGCTTFAQPAPAREEL